MEKGQVVGILEKESRYSEGRYWQEAWTKV